MPYYRVKLKPQGPFFKGINSHARKSNAIVHSDVLHTAFIYVSATVDPTWLNKIDKLKLSSIYPYYQNIYFYPRPFPPTIKQNKNTQNLSIPKETEEDSKTIDQKIWKKIHYISEGVFAEILTNPEFFGNMEKYIQKTDTNYFLHKNEELPKKLPTTLVKENYTISIVIDRQTNHATPFPRNFYEINTSENVGLWFFAELDENDKDSFKNVLEALGSLGLGGERSAGYGHFTVTEIEPFQSNNFISLTNDSQRLCLTAHKTYPLNSAITLSLYYPTIEEVKNGILNGIASYECTVRGGWIRIAGDTIPKKLARMCIEGSIFPAKEHEIENEGQKMKYYQPKGDVINLTPDNYQNNLTIYRSGLAFNIYFNIPQNNKEEY